MHVINSIGINDAYAQGLRYVCSNGELQGSRAGEVLVCPTPVSIVYEDPQQRVLFDPARDANPVFHIMEALWLLAGRNDAKWLDQFVHDFSSRFAEDDGHLHGSYGFRWRHHFDMEGGGNPNLPDQIDTVVQMLKKDPLSRRAVLQMWDPASDLNANKNDLPCNVCVMLRVREDRVVRNGTWVTQQFLDMLVCCRSNDLVWGALGSNLVQFSVLLEYLAGRIGVSVGRYVQCAFNLHLYTNILGKLETPVPVVTYPGVLPMGEDWDRWDDDLKKFMAWTLLPSPESADLSYANSWFKTTAEPMFCAHWLWKKGKRQQALNYLLWHEKGMAPDWYRALVEWMKRRLARMSKEQEEKVANVPGE